MRYVEMLLRMVLKWPIVRLYRGEMATEIYVFWSNQRVSTRFAQKMHVLLEKMKSSFVQYNSTKTSSIQIVECQGFGHLSIKR